MAGDDSMKPGDPAPLPEIAVPALPAFAALVAGIVLGLLLTGTTLERPLLSVAVPVGELWLRLLKMTILPLVAGLLFTGIVQAVAKARAGVMARSTIALFAIVLAASSVVGLVATPLLMDIVPPPAEAAALAIGHVHVTGAIPAGEDYLQSLVPDNVIRSAAEDAMLPVILFVTLFALASTRLADVHRRHLAMFFEALAGAMMVVIGWVLALAPFGILALSFAIAVRSGTSAVASLAHYVALVSAVGLIVVAGAYLLARIGGGQSPARLFRALLPAQAVAISTQSSLASLPAMIASCRSLGLKDGTGEFVLPLAVALFRATSPAMNLAVVWYVARMMGIEPSLAALVTAGAVAVLASLSTVSLPGTISFIATIAPIAIAMGVPVEPLALLVAVEMLPDVVRTLGNVTMDVAAVSVVDRRSEDDLAQADQK